MILIIIAGAGVKRRSPRLTEQNNENKSKKTEKIIPTGKEIPRTPATGRDNILDSDKSSEDKQQNQNKKEPIKERILNIDEIVIKRPKSVKSPEPIKKPKENFIPSGLNNLPRLVCLEKSF